ncbi:MAG: Sec-independent protein translocase subunit TatA [Mycobacteriales bacterium]
MPGGWELVLVLVVILVVFGSKRLPDSARSLGRSLRILKAETKGLRSDDEPASLPPAAPRFDAMTGEPLQRFDPYTGEALNPPASPDQPR